MRKLLCVALLLSTGWMVGCGGGGVEDKKASKETKVEIKEGGSDSPMPPGGGAAPAPAPAPGGEGK